MARLFTGNEKPELKRSCLGKASAQVLLTKRAFMSRKRVARERPCLKRVMVGGAHA